MKDETNDKNAENLTHIHCTMKIIIIVSI